MVCGGFTCSKNALSSLNVVYMLVGLLLIGVAAWGKGFGIVSSIHIIGGVIAVGVFLLLISIVGLVGAINHHQVLLFFYMVILFLVFIIQFGVSCSCLAINRGQQGVDQETETVSKQCQDWFSVYSVLDFYRVHPMHVLFSNYKPNELPLNHTYRWTAELRGFSARNSYYANVRGLIIVFNLTQRCAGSNYPT
ncbi:UNVERIFIED_CONTAM: hypothetical protein FKN15_058402 [Acipenser sinensis]